MFDLLVSTFQAGLREIEADQILTSGYEKVFFFNLFMLQIIRFYISP